MKQNKFIYRRLVQDVFWIGLGLFILIVGINLDSTALKIIGGGYIGFRAILLILLLIDMIAKDDVRVVGTIVETSPEIIVLKTERGGRIELIKRHWGIADAGVDQHATVIRTRRTYVINGLEI